MKKILLLITLSLSGLTFAQDTVITEDCSGLTLGDLGTDITGVTVGQNGWYTFVSSAAVPAGANSDFQVVDSATSNGKVIQINGSAAAATTTTSQSRQIYRDFTADWTNRTAGNDFVQLEFDLYTGDPTSSLSTYRTYIYNTNNKAVAGLYFEPGTKIIKGWAYIDNTATAGGVLGYYVYKLGVDNTTTPATAVDITLADNTWYRVAVAYDFNTGAITWKEATGLFYTGTSSSTIPGDPGVDLFKVAMQVSSATANTIGAAVQLDNISLNFNATETLLGTKNNTVSDSSFSVFPNPAKNLVNIKNASGYNVTNIEVTDINGRIVKNNSYSVTEPQVSISDLTTGIYMLKITTDQGTVTKKLIKE